MSALPLATRPLATGAYAPQAPSEDRLERSYGQLAQCQSRLASPAAASPRESLRPNDAVLAMVAHELRGPLAPLRLAAELLRRTCAGQPETLRTLGMIERQITQIAQLAEDLMDAARVDHHALRLVKIRTCVADVMADAVDAARLAAAKKGQTLRVTSPEQPVQIDADPGRLAQALHNLLHNAEKYTPPGGCIDLNVHAEGAELVISVNDNGLGISAALLPHVFELFSQSSRTIGASAGGMGIGLSVVKAVAEAHGGSATANSDGPGCGSAFVLRMPIVVAQTRARGALPDFRWR
jgi:signal transduction histidine kinase